MDVAKIQDQICKSMCADVQVLPRPDGRLLVQTPFTFPDGDGYSIYLQQLPSGGVRITDLGNTLMRLSYSEDIDKFTEGTRAKILDRIIAEHGLVNSDGEFLLETPASEIGPSLFRFGQALTHIHDLSYLKRARVESTFYEDLARELSTVVKAEIVHPDYEVPELADAGNYVIDFCIDGERPLFVFGVPGADKAKLTTITLQYLQKHQTQFESLLVFADQAKLPARDFQRLMNVGGEMISSLAAHDELQQKIQKRVRPEYRIPRQAQA
jgi:hypothetical protein